MSIKLPYFGRMKNYAWPGKRQKMIGLLWLGNWFVYSKITLQISKFV